MSQLDLTMGNKVSEKIRFSYAIIWWLGKTKKPYIALPAYQKVNTTHSAGTAKFHTSQLDLTMGNKVSKRSGFPIQLFRDWGRRKSHFSTPGDTIMTCKDAISGQGRGDDGTRGHLKSLKRSWDKLVGTAQLVEEDTVEGSEKELRGILEEI